MSIVDSVIIEQDVSIILRDSVTIFADINRPVAGIGAPLIAWLSGISGYGQI